MRKILLMLLIVGLFCSGASAVESGDIYLHRNELENILELNNLKLLQEFDKRFNELEKQIVRIDEHVKNVETNIGWILSFLGALIAFFGVVVGVPTVQKFLQWIKENKNTRQSITLDDVKKLIAESKMS